MRKGITFKAARRAIQFGDNESASFVLHAMGHDVADPAHFDLVVNTETYMHESAPSGPLYGAVPSLGRAL